MAPVEVYYDGEIVDTIPETGGDAHIFSPEGDRAAPKYTVAYNSREITLFTPAGVVEMAVPRGGEWEYNASEDGWFGRLQVKVPHVILMKHTPE